MKSHWQRIKTAVRLSVAAVAVAAGCIGIWGAWNANLLSDAALVNSPWNGGDWPDNVTELRNMLFGYAVCGALFTAWGFIKIRDWVLASPKVKRALSLSARLACGILGALLAYVGVFLLLARDDHSAGIGAASLANGVGFLVAAVIGFREWVRAGRIA